MLFRSEALEHAQGFLRSELARRVQLRTFPRLRFHWDATEEKAETIEKLIASLHTGDSAGTESGEPDARTSTALDEQ